MYLIGDAIPARMAISPQEIYDVCSQKLEHNPSQMRLLLSRASAAIRLSNPELALEDLNRYIEGNPNDCSARLLRSECAEQLANRQLALEDLDFVLQMLPEHPEALFRRAKLLAEMQDREGAIESFELAIEYEHTSKCSETSSTASSFEIKTYEPFEPHKFDIIVEKKSVIEVIKNRIASNSSERGVGIWLKNGIELRHAGKLEDATAAFTRAYQEEESVEALLNRAFCYDQMERYQSAILDYERVIRLDTTCALAWHNLGVCYDKLEQREKAIECFDKAIQIDEQVDFLISRAWTRREMGNYDLALADYDRGLEIQPNCYKILFARAFTFEKAGDLTKSLQDYSSCIKIDPKQFAYHNRGNVLARLGQHKLAIQDFSTAIGLNEEAAESYLSRAQSLMEVGKKQQALSDYQTAYQISHSLEHGLALADAYKRLGSFKEALATYNVALEKFPEQEVEILAQRALVYRKLNMFKEVLSDTSKALVVNPSDAKLLTNRGYAYAQLEYYELAIQDFTKALKEDPKNSQALLNRGISLDKIGREEEALKDLTTAIQLNPNDSASYFSRGATLDSLGRYEEAMSDYTKALELENRVDSKDAKSTIPRVE